MDWHRELQQSIHDEIKDGTGTCICTAWGSKTTNIAKEK